MKSKGTQMRKFRTFREAAQKIVIKKPWGVEVKSYKAGDPIPAGVEFKIFDANDTAKIEAYADSLDESADYQKKRFKEPAYMYNESKKVVSESLSSKTHKFKPEELKVGKRVIDKVGGYEVHGKITVNHHDLYKDNPYTQDKKGSTVVTITTDKGRSYDVDANDNGGEFILEGRIAKGYENLDADEKARHLLSHPSSKYMNDLKSENITERAIRKAVKEMLGKPDKRDPQFIIDVNEEGEAPAATTTTANVANPELPLKLKESFVLQNSGTNDWVVAKHQPDKYKREKILGLTWTPEKMLEFSSKDSAQKFIDKKRSEGYDYLDGLKIVDKETAISKL